MNDKKKSIYKTITWRITATTTTLLLVYLLTGEMKIAGSVALLESVIKMGLYYAHERAWENVTLTEDDSFNQAG